MSSTPNESADLAAAGERLKRYAISYGHTEHARDLTTILNALLAALASAQRDAAQLERAKGLIREAMRHGVNGSDGYDARNASETGQDMRIFLLNNTTP